MVRETSVKVRPDSARRVLLSALATLPLAARTGRAASAAVLRFGLTPVFLSNDLELLSKLKNYLSRQTGREVQLVQRRTYEEITALLLSDQLTAAWICGYPLVQYRDKLGLVAVPLWRKQPLYSSYLIVSSDRGVAGIDDLRGDLHAFSDPNSNSGYLVTAALMAEKGVKPEGFFRDTIFTYGHRNVVRAVASGLAQSGSVDGYVWEVMASLEPELTSRTKVIRKSELLGFPPVACLAAQANSTDVDLIRKALLSMAGDPEGRAILSLLKLDGFAEEPQSLYDPIAAKMQLLRSLSP
ncbi:PhnD/SsuA/transferrin family substrate-binding protein [Aestuariivirga sp.]|uniref:substrate-binding domain-containing protein n=1 Tax=Aestuariivirga sp. TaxID=2650926 RepID=UPI00391B3149